MKKRFFAFLVLILTFAMLAGCANIDPDAVSDYESADEKETSSEVSLPEYDGFSDKIIIATTDTSPFIAYEDTVGTLSAAINDRDRLLAEKYSVEIQTAYYTEEQVIADATSSGLAGLKLADIYCFSAELTLKLSELGKLCDISTLPQFDEIKAAADENGLINGSDGSVCAVVHSSTLYQQSAYCVFYNKDLLKTSGMESPAALCVQGQWNHDTFLRYAHTFAAVIMNKGSIDYEQDIFGFAAIDSDDVLETVLRFSPAGEQEEGADIVADILSDRSRYNRSGNAAADVFKQGRCGMLIYKLDYCRALDETEINYGILPMPGGKGYVGSEAMVYSLATPEDAEYSGAVLLTLLSASGDMFAEALKNSYTLLYSSDNGTTVMIDKVIKGAGLFLPVGENS